MSKEDQTERNVKTKESQTEVHVQNQSKQIQTEGENPGHLNIGTKEPTKVMKYPGVGVVLKGKLVFR
jgi:hypothetical protein